MNTRTPFLLKNMTPTAWQRFRLALGLPGETKVKEISGDEIIAALILAKSRQDNQQRREA